MYTIRSFPLPRSFAPPEIIALRINYRLAGPLWPAFGPLPPLELDAGAESALLVRRAGVVLTQSADHLTVSICYGIVCVFGSVLLGLFMYDRRRCEFLLLSLTCYGPAPIYLDYACADALVIRGARSGLSCL